MEEQVKEQGLESYFEQLEEIVSALEQEDISLEDAFGSYSKGMELVRRCNEQIDRVEKKVQMINSRGELEEL